MTRFINKRFAVIAAVLFGVLGTVFGGFGIASAATSSTTPPPARIGCIAGPNRTVQNAYENVPANFKCPSGFAVSLSTPGAPGKDGTNGTDGTNGLTGAYYAVAKYDVGDTNGGAVATVACKSTTDVAISGGVQTLALGTNGLNHNIPVSSSFPGRMDWNTNTPIAGRLDGWIVQFGAGGLTGVTGDPNFVDIYALCVPSATIPVDTTFAESAS